MPSPAISALQMPSPAIIPCSSSDPNFTETHQSQPYAPPSNHSVSAKSPKFISAWQVGKLITRKNSPSSKNSDLTQENLEAFNRINEALDEKKNATSSPYYRGLTDSSLVINKDRQFPQGPGIESHAPSSVSWGSKSTFIVKVQEWTSCFTFGSKVDNGVRDSSSSSSSWPLKPREKTTAAAAAAAKESAGERENTTIFATQKSLRERVSEPSPPRLASLPPPRTPSPRPISPTAAPLPLLMLSKGLILKDKDTKELVKERDFVWADRYRPVALKDFICNRKTAIELQTQIVKNADNCGHFLFEGLPGVGKRTMIWALLREAYGAERIKARDEQKEFDLTGEGVGTIQVQVKASLQHVEVNLSDLKGYEKHVIVELIKESNNRLASKAMQCNRDNYRAIILYKADKLSTDALLYIRWLLERYRGYNNIFFCCSDVSKLQPIKSLCKVVQLLPPSTEEIIEVLEFIARQEGIVLPRQMAERIARKSKNNLRQAIRSFEATWQTNSSLKDDQEIMTGWEDDIANIAINIVEEQSPRQLYVIRGKLQTLIDHNVSSEFIFKSLKAELKKHLDEPLQIETQIDNLYEEYNWDEDSEKPFTYLRNQHEEIDKKHNDPRRKSIHHFMRIEEFIAKLMSRYKIAVMKNKGV